MYSYSVPVLCLILFLVQNVLCDKLPHEENDEQFQVSYFPSHENRTSMADVSKNMGFFQAFFSAFSVIIVSELGDKTFFIAAIMAMKHSRALVFLGAILALALMTILSVAFGLAATIIPKVYTYYISTVLFLLFGLKMLWDGIRMSSTEGQDELEEVQADLRRREEELAAKEAKKSASSDPQDVKPVSTQVLPVIETIDNSNFKCDLEQNGSTTTGKDALSLQFEKEALNKDPEAGTKIKHSSKKKVMKLLSHIVLQAFTLTFLAEWGDRSQITTIILAAKDNVYGVTLGGVLGHGLCTGLAVLGGRFVAQKISVRTVTIAGGVVFILFALMTFFLDASGAT